MAQKLTNYLRTYRRRASFTQDEMAFLLGTASGTRVSRYERFGRQPGLRTAFAYQVVFAVSQQQLFGGIYELVEHEVRERAAVLIGELGGGSTGPRDRLKLDVLENVVSKNS